MIYTKIGRKSLVKYTIISLFLTGLFLGLAYYYFTWQPKLIRANPDSWLGEKCKNITLTEGGHTDRTNEPIEMNLTGLTISSGNASQEIRIVNESCGADGTTLPVDVLGTDDSTYAYVVFLANVSKSSSNVYSVYYDNSSAVAPNYYESDFTISTTTFNTSNLWGHIKNGIYINVTVDESVFLRENEYGDSNTRFSNETTWFTRNEEDATCSMELDGDIKKRMNCIGTHANNKDGNWTFTIYRENYFLDYDVVNPLSANLSQPYSNYRYYGQWSHFQVENSTDVYNESINNDNIEHCQNSSTSTTPWKGYVAVNNTTTVAGWIYNSTGIVDILPMCYKAGGSSNKDMEIMVGSSLGPPSEFAYDKAYIPRDTWRIFMYPSNDFNYIRNAELQYANPLTYSPGSEESKSPPTPTGNKLNVSLDYPSDGGTETSWTAQFNYTPTVSGDTIHNCSVWVNGTLNTTNSTGVANATMNSINITFSEEQDYEWTAECWNSTTPVSATNRTFTMSIPNPQYFDVGTNNTFASNDTLFCVRWTDANALSHYIFSTNNTGTWKNDTEQSLSGTEDWSNVSKTLNETANIGIGWMVYANNSENKWNVTENSLTTTVQLAYENQIEINVTNIENQTWELIDIIFDTENSNWEQTAIPYNDSIRLWNGTCTNKGSEIISQWYNVTHNSTGDGMLKFNLLFYSNGTKGENSTYCMNYSTSSLGFPTYTPYFSYDYTDWSDYTATHTIHFANGTTDDIAVINIYNTSDFWIGNVSIAGLQSSSPEGTTYRMIRFEDTLRQSLDFTTSAGVDYGPAQHWCWCSSGTCCQSAMNSSPRVEELNFGPNSPIAAILKIRGESSTASGVGYENVTAHIGVNPNFEFFHKHTSRFTVTTKINPTTNAGDPIWSMTHFSQFFSDSADDNRVVVWNGTPYNSTINYPDICNSNARCIHSDSGTSYDYNWYGTSSIPSWIAAKWEKDWVMVNTYTNNKSVLYWMLGSWDQSNKGQSGVALTTETPTGASPYDLGIGYYVNTFWRFLIENTTDEEINDTVAKLYNNSDVNWVFVEEIPIPDTTHPQWNGNLTFPTSPTSYGQTYWFNVTWVDETGFSVCLIEQNFTTITSTLENVSMTKEGDECYYTVSSNPPLGTYVWRSYGNDTSNNQNVTDQWIYIINQKGSTTLHLAINDTEGDKALTYPSYSNVTAWKTVSGGTLGLERDGTSVSNPDIEQYERGSYSFNTYLVHENYTASNVTRTLTIQGQANPLTLTASPSWSVLEGVQTTVTCTATSGTPTLKRNDVTVSNPDTSTLAEGSYEYNCSIIAQNNYTSNFTTNTLTVSSVGIEGTGCTSNTTFAFYKQYSLSSNMTIINFSSLATSNTIKSDLSDVYTNYTTWVNTTTKLIAINTSGVSDLYVYFGNYYSNISHDGWAFGDDAPNYTMSDYTVLNPYYIITIKDETDREQKLPPSSNISMKIYCSIGVNEFTIDDTNFLLATNEQPTDLLTIVDYDSSSYRRNLITRATSESKTFYLVDANVDQVVQILIKLQDNTGDFGDATLKIKKYLEGTLETITELAFDAEDKAIAYLINEDKYQVYVDSGTEERNIGYLYVDSIDLEKTLVISDVTTTNITESNISIGLPTLSDGTITFTWFDPGDNTQEIEFWVYNYTNQSQLLYYASSTNRSRIDFNYAVPDVNGSYMAKWLVKHGIYGNQITGGQEVLKGTYLYPAVFPLAYLITNLGGSTTIWLTLIFILSIPMMFTEKYVGIGAIVTVAVVGLLVYWEQYTVAGGVIALSLFLAVLIFIKRRKSGKI